MKKDILYEVYRIQELIGIQKNILKENKYIDFLSDMIKDFIAVSKKTIPNVADEVMVGAIQVEKKVFDDIIEVLNNPQLYDVLGDAEKTIFARIVAQSPEIVDDVYKKVFSEFVNNTDASEKQLISKIAQEYTNGKQISQIIKEMSGSDDPFVPTLLTKKIFGKVNDFKSGKFVEEVTSKPKVDDKLGKIIKNVGKEIPTMGPSENINWINKFLASNKTIFNLVRRTTNSALLRYEKKVLGNEEFIKRTFQDILRVTNKINNELLGDVSKIDSNKILTELRNISSKIKVIQDVYGTSLDGLYKEIEESLMKNVSDSKTKELIPEFMKKLKEVDPFAIGTLEQKSYLLKFLNSTATQQTINNIGRLLKSLVMLKKEAGGEIKQLASRLPAFLLTGAPKTLEDVQSYFVKYGDVKGLLYLTRDIWLASHIGVPLTMAGVDTLYNLLLLGFTPVSGVPRETIWNDYLTNLNNDFLNQYKGMRGLYDEDEINLLTVVYGLLPGHAYGVDFGEWLVGLLNKTEEGKSRPKENIPQQLKDVFEKNKIPKNVQDSMITAIQNAPSADEAAKMVENSIGNTESLQKFKDFIKKDWKTDYTGSETYKKDGNYYVVSDGVWEYYYTYNGETFVEDKSKHKKIK